MTTDLRSAINMTKMIAGQALVKFLESWEVDHIYLIPGCSIYHTVEGV